MSVTIKRIYEPASTADGYRILVDRLWPRGLKKEAAHIDEWLKEVAPSADLRKWFNHEPEKWPQFVKKYRTELGGSDAFETLLTRIKAHKRVTLLYGAKDERHNQAAALKEFIKQG
ncbi:DUF488 domain-containing protein [Compostibacter hankyongensis]|uniref:DUF488 domain-containing protein n=1 Tax=Compostibacter hankyongensis TaxID=1007089 RepID=A0ABP8G106_9BACT